MESALVPFETDFATDRLLYQLQLMGSVFDHNISTVTEMAEMFCKLPPTSKTLLSEVEKLITLLLTIPAIRQRLSGPSVRLRE